MFNVCGPASNGVILGRLLAKLNNLPRCAETTRAVLTIVVTKLYIGSALVSAMYGRSRELGLYLWGNRPLPTVQGRPLSMDSGLPPHGGWTHCGYHRYLTKLYVGRYMCDMEQ